MRVNEYAKFRETDKREKKRKTNFASDVRHRRLWLVTAENRSRRWPRGSLTRYAAHDISERRREDRSSPAGGQEQKEKEISTCARYSPRRSSSGSAGAGALRRESRSIDIGRPTPRRTRIHPCSKE